MIVWSRSAFGVRRSALVERDADVMSLPVGRDREENNEALLSYCTTKSKTQNGESRTFLSQRRTPNAARRTLLLLLLTCLASLVAVEARIELPDPLIPGAMMEGTVILENSSASMQKIEFPDVAGVEWHMRSGRSQQTSVMNGKVTSSESVRIGIRIAAMGTYQIPGATVRLSDGSAVVTAPLTITVSQADASLKGEAFAEAFFEPNVLIPGQPTTLVYRVSLRQDRPRATQDKPSIGPPTNAISLGEMTTTTGNTYDAEGVQWSVRTWRWPLTFSSPDTYTVTGQQTWYRCRRGMFNNLEAISEHQIAVKPATLTVSPMPSEGRPDDFSGLIGAVQVEAQLERNRIATGEGVVLTVTYRGRGVELLGRPAFAPVGGLTTYEKEDEKKEATPGERTFRWDLVPAAVGECVIPPFTVPFFDPNSRTYQRASSDELRLTVIPGRARSAEVVGAVNPHVVSAAPSVKAANSIAVNPVMPAPLRGIDVTSIPWTWGMLAAFGGVIIGAGAGIALRVAGSMRRGPHHGRQLMKAVASGDLDMISSAVHQLTPLLVTDTQRSAAQRLQQAVDLARFGKRPLDDDAKALAQELAGIA